MGGAHQGDDRDVASLRIGDVDHNQALVVRSQGHTAAVAVQRLPNTSASRYQQETGDSVTLQEQLHQLQQQMEGVLGKIQQTDQQTQHAQHQTQDQIDRILQTLQQTNRQLTEDAQRMTQQLDLHRQELEEVQHTSQQQLQKQIEMVQQKTQQLDQDSQDSRQQMQDIRQQAQQQIDKVFSNIQELDQKAQHSEQQHKQLLQQMRGMATARQAQDWSSPELGNQKTQYAINQFVHAQYRVQTVLATTSPNLPIPRLFIILPTPTAAVDGREGSHLLQFRLYFLCECGAHTTAQDCSEPHEIHLANHSGYDLIRQDEFINKYGTYLLTMMHLVKHGAKARGLVVSPLLGLNRAIEEGQIIGQLVDDTITHLMEVTGCIDGDTTTHQSLDAIEFAELKPHLKGKDGEVFSGGLSRIKVQKSHYTWICSDHLRKCYASTLQQLRYNINASFDTWHGNEVKAKVTSEATIKQFYDDFGKLFRIQNVENWRSIMEIDLELDSHQSLSNSTTNILSGFDDLESLSLDFGRFTMAVKGVSRGEVKYVAISIRDLSAPTLDDIEFIQQCRPTALTVLEISQVKDENRLIKILQHNLESLRIECHWKHYITVIDLVGSIREKMLQSGDTPALRVFELVHPEIKVKVSFEEGSPAFDVETCIKLEDFQPETVDPAVYTFIRQYGWSVTTFVMRGSFSDPFARLLDESVQEKGSRIAHFNMAPSFLATSVVDSMSRVINRSQSLTYLRLSLENLDQDQQLEKALDLLERHKNRLTNLCLKGSHIDGWLPRCSGGFSRDAFPALKEFYAECYGGSLINGRWFSTMVAGPLPHRTSLRAIGINILFDHTQHQEDVIKAIDLSALEELHFNRGDCKGFTQVQLKLLVDRIMDHTPSPPLRLLNLNGTGLSKNVDTYGQLARLREKIPDIRIIGIGT